MASLLAQRLSRTLYTADGSTVEWNFNFSGGYLSQSHVKATVTPVGGIAEDVHFPPHQSGMTGYLATFTGPNQLRIQPPAPNGAVLAIYRDTPKDLPIVDFTDGSGLSDTSLDTNAKQAVFIAAELADVMGVADVNTAVQAAASATAASAAAVAANAQAQLAVDTLRGANTTVSLSGTGSQTAFLVVQPDEDARCDVFVQGIYQHTSTWSLVNGVLTFAVAPIAGTNNIEVVISTNIPADELSPLAAAAAASASAAASSALAAADASRLTVGTVTTLAPGSTATATIVGPSGSQSLNLGLPRGANGNDGLGTGDMLKSVYDPNDDGKVTAAVTADVAVNVPWSGVTSPPATYAPSAHTHTAANISDSTTVGRSVLTAADATAARTAIGAGEGYINIPVNSQSAAYTTVLSDAGKTLLHPSADTTARTFTIAANASVPYQIGTAITFVNQNAAGAVTIAIATDTMRLAGAGTTGSRTLAANGMATALKLTATEWIINGTGLT